MALRVQNFLNFILFVPLIIYYLCEVLNSCITKSHVFFNLATRQSLLFFAEHGADEAAENGQPKCKTFR